MIIYAKVDGTRTWMLDVRNKEVPIVPEAPTGAVRMAASDPGRITLGVRQADELRWSYVTLGTDEVIELMDGLRKMLEEPKEEEE